MGLGQPFAISVDPTKNSFPTPLKTVHSAPRLPANAFGRYLLITRNLRQGAF
jgi:hypothetical protein